MPKFLFSVVFGVGIVLTFAGCAVQADRTAQLLELDLADRSRAIVTLERDNQQEPAAWRYYSLGVLYGDEADFETMTSNFEKCQQLSDLYNEKIRRVRHEYWRDWALKADKKAEQEDWVGAVTCCEKALQAAPEKQETRIRQVQSRIMAWGPSIEEIRTLVAVGQIAVLDRWLESVNQTGDQEIRELRLDVKVRLQSFLSGVFAKTNSADPADLLACFIVGELCRLDGDWPAMDKWYSKANGSTLPLSGTINRVSIMSANRNSLASDFLNAATDSWSNGNITLSLAQLDTASLILPGRGDIASTRNSIEQLALARTPQQVHTCLAVGDYDTSWLSLWMTQLHTGGLNESAALVADRIISAGDLTKQQQKTLALRVRADWRSRSGNLAGAIEDLRLLLESGQGDATAALSLGDVLVAESRYEEADFWYDKSVQWGGADVKKLLRKSRVAFYQARFNDMLNLCEQAVALAPENVESNNLLADARQLAGLPNKQEVQR